MTITLAVGQQLPTNYDYYLKLNSLGLKTITEKAICSFSGNKRNCL